MSMNPMMEMVARTRMAEMRQVAVTRSLVSRRTAIASGEGSGPSPIPHSTTRPEKARRAVGWFLVGLGLRLAVSRPRVAVQ